MKINTSRRSGFTMVEILIVLGVVAVLALTVIYFLNPSQLASQGQDTNRLADLTSLNQNVALYHETLPAGSLGANSVIYISVPDPTATSTAGDQCQGLGLTAPGSFTYHCAASSSYRNINGTGWIPINFSGETGVTFSALPVDPINTTSTGEYYEYVASGTQYEVVANPESPKTYANNETSSYTQGNGLSLLNPSSSTFNGTIYLSDVSNHHVAGFSASGAPVIQFGGATLSSPAGIAVDASGNFWVTDYSNNNVEEFSSSGAYLSEFGSSGSYGGSGNGQFLQPIGIAIDASGNIWVVDTDDNRVQEFSSNGTYESQFGTSGSGDGQFSYPYAIAIDGAGNMWIADGGNSRVEEFSSNGTYESQFGTEGTGNGQFYWDESLAVDQTGNIWVADTGNDRVEEFEGAEGNGSITPPGTYIAQFGSYGTGPGQFYDPSHISIDSSGDIWVAEYDPPFYGGAGAEVQEFSANGSYVSQIFPSGVGYLYGMTVK